VRESYLPDEGELRQLQLARECYAPDEGKLRKLFGRVTHLVRESDGPGEFEVKHLIRESYANGEGELRTW
jgi:hypothetical protein